MPPACDPVLSRGRANEQGLCRFVARVQVLADPVLHVDASKLDLGIWAIRRHKPVG